MPADFDTVFVSLALARGFLTAEQVEECLRAALENPGPSLPVLLRENGFLDEAKFRALSEEVFDRGEDPGGLGEELFGFLCMQRKHVRGFHIAAHRLSCEKGGLRIPLRDFLVREGLLTPAQADDIEAHAANTLAACPGCGTKYPPPPPGTARLCCPSCGRVFAPASRARDGGGPRHALGPFDIHGEIGKGSMGLVLLGRHRETGRKVAVKILPADASGDEAMLERFRREADAARTLSHPAVVPVVEVGEEEGTAFLAMEYVEGKSLEALLAARDLGFREAARIGIEASEALDHAHRKGVVHRDIKPGNVMIDTLGRVRICDFGLAKQRDVATITASGFVVGTPMYMSPEQADPRAPVDHRTDIYSLGATLFEAVTGRPPFEGRDVNSLIRKVKAAEPSLPSRLRPGIPRPLERILLKALEKNPAHRYGRARGLAEDLARFLDGRPVHAPSPRSPLRLLRRIHRRREALFLALLAVVLLVAALGLLGRSAPSGPAGAPGAEEAFSAFRMGEYARAEALYTLRLQSSPTPEALVFRALARHALGRSDEALLDLGRARSLWPARPRPHREAARILMELGRLGQADAALSQHLALAPADPQGWTLCGDLRRAQERQAEARRAYDRALQADPGHLPALRGAFEADLAAFAFASARRRLRALQPSLPTPGEAEYLRGRLALSAGRNDEARALFLRAESLGVEHPGFARATAAARLGLGPVAHLDAALLVDVADSLAKNRAPDALAAVERYGTPGAASAPERAELLHLKARVLLGLGRTGEACRAMEEALRLGPGRWGMHLSALASFRRLGRGAVCRGFEEALQARAPAEVAAAAACDAGGGGDGR